jgi:energy-coupling factor transport system permease protein
MAIPLAYRPLASPLHATRATVGACWALCLLAAAVVVEHPLVLGAIGLAVLGAAFAAGVGRQMLGALRFALIVGLPIVIVNVLVARQGLTVFARIGDLGPFGQGDLTVEALVYGLVIALKVTLLIVICALASVTVDPDEMLTACRALSFRSALTASLALRMLPLLASDAQRLAQAQRTRPDGGGQGLRRRGLLIAATVGGALDRALDVAATLELRGFGAAKRARAPHRPVSRHDIAFLGSGSMALALVLSAQASGAASFSAYPLLHCPTSIVTACFCVAIVPVVLLPFVDRRGIDPR